jgi:hypothetical protein
MPAPSSHDPRQGGYLYAEWLRDLKKMVDAFRRMEVVPPLKIRWTGDRPVIAVDDTEATCDDIITARIIAKGAGAFYSWQQVEPDELGNWLDIGLSGDISGDTAALEQNGNTAVQAGVRVDMIKVNKRWVFQLGPCNPTGKSPEIPPIPAAMGTLTPPPNVNNALAAAAFALIRESPMRFSTVVIPPLERESDGRLEVRSTVRPDQRRSDRIQDDLATESPDESAG